MKNLIIFLLAFAGLSAANVQIETLPTTAVLPFSDDFGIQSGSTRGTAKFAMTQLCVVTATRATLAAFSITGVADGIGAAVLGATSAGDGGASLYVWSASSTATPNGNTVILPASSPGTGRWLKALGGVGAPGVSTLGGVFSNVGSSHNWIKSINTDGTVTLAQPAAGDITGLGGAATLNVGTGAGTVAAGDDSRIVGSLQSSANLSDLSNTATAQTNLGLGTFAAQNYATPPAIGGTTPNAGSFLGISLNPGSTPSAGFVSFSGGTTGGPAWVNTAGTGIDGRMGYSNSLHRYYFYSQGSTLIANLDASGLFGLAGVTAVNGSFTNIGSSTSVSGAGFTAYFASPPPLGSSSPNTVSATVVTAASGGTGASIIGSASGSSAVESLTDTGANGAGVSMTNLSGAGGGATRYLRARAGYIETRNSANTVTTSSLDDSGNLAISGVLQQGGTTNVKAFQAKGNGVIVNSSSVSITSGSATLSVTGGGFGSGDIGKAIVIKGAGAAGVPLVTTIAGVTNTTTITLSATASTTVSGASQAVPYGTDDTNAINAAIAALPVNNGILYFPAGVYMLGGNGSNASLSGIGGLTNLSITGDGASISHIYNAVVSVGTGVNTFVVSNTCSGVNFSSLWADGLVTSRQHGIHFRIGSPKSSIKNCWISGSSDFGAFFDDTTTAVTDCTFTGNLVFNTAGDGVHFSNANRFIASHNIFDQCGDDAIAALGNPPGTTDVAVNGVIEDNVILGRTTPIAGANTTGHRGIAVQYATNLLISGNYIYGTKSTGIEVSDDSNSSFYCQYIAIKGNHLFGCVTSAGPLAAIELYFAKDCSVTANFISNPITASGILVTDFANVDVSGNTVDQNLNQFCRGLVCDSGTSYSGRSFASTWTNLTVSSNTFNLAQASSNEAVYLMVNSSLVLRNLIIDGNRAFVNPGNYITADYLANAKAVNNTSIPTSGSSTVALGSHSTGTLSVNNN